MCGKSTTSLNGKTGIAFETLFVIDFLTLFFSISQCPDGGFPKLFKSTFTVPHFCISNTPLCISLNLFLSIKRHLEIEGLRRKENE
ncbi:hypothetical protein TURTL08_18640 [Turicimonas sp. TL08]